MRVTEILKAAGLREFPAYIRPEEMAWLLERGTAIHAATVLYDQGVLDWSSLDERIVGFVRGYERFRKEVGGEVVAMEMEVSGPGYTGHLDRVFKGTAVCPGLLLADIKTNAPDKVTGIQTMAYALGYGKKVKRCGIGLFEEGTYKLEFYEQDATDRAAWQACQTIAAWKRRNGI